MNKVERKIEKTVTRLVQLFVEQKYNEIADWSKNTRLTADEIKEEIDDYGCGQKVIFPPANFFDDVGFIVASQIVF